LNVSDIKLGTISFESTAEAHTAFWRSAADAEATLLCSVKASAVADSEVRDKFHALAAAVAGHIAFGPSATPAQIAFYERMLIASPADARANVDQNQRRARRTGVCTAGMSGMPIAPTARTLQQPIGNPLGVSCNSLNCVAEPQRCKTSAACGCLQVAHGKVSYHLADGAAVTAVDPYARCPATAAASA